MKTRVNHLWSEIQFPIWAQPAQEGAHENQHIVWYIIWQKALDEEPGFPLESAGTPCYFATLDDLVARNPGIVDWEWNDPPVNGGPTPVPDRIAYVVSSSLGYYAFGGVESREEAIMEAVKWIASDENRRGENFRVKEVAIDENEDYDVVDTTWTHEFVGTLRDDDIDDWMAASTEVTDAVRITMGDAKYAFTRTTAEMDIRDAAQAIYRACACETGNAVVILGGWEAVAGWIKDKIEQIPYNREWHPFYGTFFAMGSLRMPEEEWVPDNGGSTLIYQDVTTGEWRKADGVHHPDTCSDMLVELSR